MKRVFIILLSLLPSLGFAQGLNAIYSFTSYQTPEGRPYIEVNLSIDASSVEYINNRARVEVVLIISQEEEIKHIEKREINAQKSKENANSIIDIQRIALNNGEYKAELSFRDINAQTEALVVEDEIRINYPKDEVAVSGVQLVESYTKTETESMYSKNGYDIIPYPFEGIPENRNQIHYYAEVYNADKKFGEDNYYAVGIALEEALTKTKLSNFQRIRREKTSPVNIIMGGFDIQDLPEGYYNLVVEARDANNHLFAYSSTGFIRYAHKDIKEESFLLPEDAFVNKINEEDIDEHLHSIHPIASEMHKDFLRKEARTASLEEKRNFLFNFWRQINFNNPEGEWKYYMTQVDYVNKTYSTRIRKGYETDMGRVYLVYGEPDKIIDEKFKSTGGIKQRTMADRIANPDAIDQSPDGVSYMPYQIWRYNRTPFGESNKSFVFYAKQNNLMEYFLLHSDAKGEPYDRFWENVLTRGVLPEGVEGEAGVQFRKGY